MTSKEKLNLKITLGTQICWALLIMFGLIGCILQQQFGMIIIAISVMCWVSLKILIEGMSAYMIWRSLNDHDGS